MAIPIPNKANKIPPRKVFFVVKGNSQVLKLKAELPFYVLSFPVPSLKTTDNEKEAYALLDAYNYLKECDEDDYSMIILAWDESTMEVGDDYYNNAEAVGGYAYKKSMHSEESLHPPTETLQ